MRIEYLFDKAYPKLGKWINTNLPKVKNKPKIWKAFLKYSELDEKKAIWAITEGFNPDITYSAIKEGNGKYVGGKYLNRVFLNKAMCDRFESTDFSNPKMHKLIESTILHEMVHWGDFKDGKSEEVEEGKLFEKEAYGHDVDVYW